MNRLSALDQLVIDLGAAGIATRGGTIAIPIEELGYYTAAGISDD